MPYPSLHHRIVQSPTAVLPYLSTLSWKHGQRTLINRRRLAFAPASEEEVDKTYTGWAGPDPNASSVPGNVAKIAPLLSLKKPRVGPTNLAPGKTARHQLDGETSANFYHEVADDLDYTPHGSDAHLPLDDMGRRGSLATSIKSKKQAQQPRSTVQPRTAPGPSTRYSVSQPSPANSSFAQMASGRRGSAFNGEGNKGWVG